MTHMQDLPALTGPEKQIAWANEIRAKQLSDWGRAISNFETATNRAVVVSIMKLLVNLASRNNCAADWIESHRHIRGLILRFIPVVDGHYDAAGEYKMLGIEYSRSGRSDYKSAQFILDNPSE